MEYLGAWGTLIHEKTMNSKISCQTPFNSIFGGRNNYWNSALVRYAVASFPVSTALVFMPLRRMLKKAAPDLFHLTRLTVNIMEGEH